MVSFVKRNRCVIFLQFLRVEGILIIDSSLELFIRVSKQGVQ